MPELLTSDEIQAGLGSLSGWTLKGKEIAKSYKFHDFKEAMRFVNAVAEEAEKLDHHPDIFVSYNRVTLTLSTHSAGGLTEKDFSLARQIQYRE